MKTGKCNAIVDNANSRDSIALNLPPTSTGMHRAVNDNTFRH